MADESKLRDYLKRVLSEARRSQQRVLELEAEKSEPIAIVGMACRLPGGIGSPEDLWRLVAERGDGVSGFPTDRGWDLDGLFDEDPEQSGKSYVSRGGFLHDAGLFDAGFFGISPREAVAMDPQQRLLLETSWEALERAGVDAAGLKGADVGVFVGVINEGYATGGPVPPELEGFTGTGTTGSVASGRISYVFGFEGPAVTVDTACSSSLVAMHLAAQALRRGECSMALAGGATVMAGPGMFMEFSRQRALASDGRCKSYADAADGTGWAEGAGVVVLERLSEARRNGHEVLAVLRGSAVNQDGASNGLTAPNGPSQQRVIRKALANAGLSTSDVDLVEGHGTGTVLGDPIEAQALLATYGQDRPAEQPLRLGSLKSNIGHTQAAAGVAGVIKMVQAMRHGVMPATLNVDAPSSQVDWSAGAVELLTEAREWPETGRPRRAGVSSFGVSGTNAHVILEQVPAEEPTTAPVPPVGVVPLVVSAKSVGSLAGQAGRLVSFVEGADAASLEEMAAALVSRRALLSERAVVVAGSREEALSGLGALARGESAASVVSGSAAGGLGRSVLVFPGQGSQWIGMGRELLDSSPVFAERVAECAAALGRWVDWSLVDVLRGEAPAELLERVDVVQPASFAVMVGLASVWASVGVVPDAVVGHSQGEIAAACVSGALSLEDAARIVAVRSQVIAGELAGRGGMASVALSETDVVERLGRWSDRVEVAAVNGPSSVVIAGDAEALDEALEVLAADGVRVRRVAVDYASHTRHVEAIEETLTESFADIRSQAPLVPFFSTVTGDWVSEPGVLDGGYWYRNLRGQVKFGPAVTELLDQGHTVFVESSAHPVLVQPINEIVDDVQPDVLVTGSLRRGEGGLRRLLTSMAELFVRGVTVDWTGVLPEGTAHVDLPTYAFDHQHYWLQLTRAVTDAASLGLAGVDHPLIGAVVEVPETGGVLCTSRLSLRTHAWLADHAVGDVVLVPGTGLVELAVRAGDEVGCGTLDELVIEAPLILPEQGGVRVQVTVGGPDETGTRTVGIYSTREDAAGDTGTDAWTRHATGVLTMSKAGGSPRFDFAAWPPPGSQRIEVDGLYAGLVGHGYEHGPVFQGLRTLWRRGDELFAEIALPDDSREEAARYGIHPALLDAALHPALRDTVAADGATSGASLWQSLAWHGLALHAVGASVLRVRIVKQGRDALSLEAVDQAGGLVLTADSVKFRSLTAEQLDAAAGTARNDSLFRVEWSELPRPAEAAAEPPSWVRVSTASEVSALADAAAAGETLPAVVVLEAVAAPDDGEDAALALTNRVLAAVQAWLAAPGLDAARLVVATRGAVPAGADGGVTDPAGGAVWGLIRAAQTENPDRIVLLDLDPDSELSPDLAPELDPVMGAVLAGGEPEVAVRGAVLSIPRLTRATAAATVRADAEVAPSGRAPVVLDPEGTVLITGGTGSLGGLLARHLVTHHGIRRLVLVSRRGRAAAGAPELVAELTELGATDVSVESCDVTDRDAVAALLAAVQQGGRRLTGVIHTAGIADAGVIGTLDPERVAQVFAPKVTAAQHLDALTRELAPDLDAFVVFSSVSSVFLGAGTGSYAAANAFLDALAHQRRAAGLSASSLAWGLWNQTAGGMAAGMDDLTRSRMNRRGGVLAMTPDEGMELFDAALRTGEALLVPAKLDLRALRAGATAGRDIPTLLRGLVRTGRQTARAAAGDSGGGLAARLSGLASVEQEALLLDLVRTHAATVLGYAGPEGVRTETAFRDSGFDSLTSVELRNRVREATGLKLATTVVFDYPTPLAFARYLHAEFGHVVEAAPATVVVADPDEPIAIVGMGCRLPGGVGSPEDLWRLVSEGRDAMSGFPSDRGWDVGGLFDEDPDKAGTSYVDQGGFLYDAGLFDARFFGISPREALAMDPQQRLLLEASWEALERAGIDPADLKGTDVGVFSGVMGQGYGAGGAVPAELEGFTGTGGMGSVASGRVAYVLGFEGPAVTVDTACSSSLVAIHLAAQSLRQGECSMALAGGATVMATPGTFVEFSRQRGLASDGRCKSYADAADGTGWAEGAGVVVLERLSEAKRKGHRVLAVVRGSAVNQDGASNGLTAPNGLSQQRVIRKALAAAGLTPADVDVVEGHGTGTVLGDPIEAQALLATYGQDRPDGQPLWLGSLKSNIGHTQMAAGVAGVIKMVQALRHGVMPPTLHVDAPSSKVDWSIGAIELLTKAQEWPETGRPRRAGVSGFGVSGTNAHLILEQAPQEAEAERPRVDPSGVVPLVVSAKSAGSLSGQAGRLDSFVDAAQGTLLSDVAAALITERSLLSERAVVVADSREEALAGFGALARGESAAGLVTGGGASGSGRTVFVFPGQGSQRVGMGRELAGRYPVFAEAFDAACAALDVALAGRVEHAVRDVVFGDAGAGEGLLDQTVFTQAGLFAVETALFRLVESWGVRPDAVMGHSVGEITAAHVAGVLSLADAAVVVAARGWLMQALPSGGAMVAVAAGEDEVAGLLGGGVSLAAVNGPSSVVLSGEADAVLAVAGQLREQGRKVKQLTVSHAFHSALMEPMLEEFAGVLADVTWGEARFPVVSNVTGELAEPGGLAGAGYWVEHVRSPVRFADGVTAAAAGDDGTVFVELGPGAALSGVVGESAGERAVCVPALRDGRSEVRTLLASLAELFVRGVEVDWAKSLPAGAGSAHVELPTYAFDHEHYWLQLAPVTDAVSLGQVSAGHPLIGAVVEVPETGGVLCTSRLSLRTHGWLADHAVGGVVLVPGTGLVELAVRAGDEVGCGVLEELVIEAPLVVPEQGGIRLQVAVGGPDGRGARAVEVYSAREDATTVEWTRHATGTLTATTKAGVAEPEFDFTAWPPPGAQPVEVDIEDFYTGLIRVGYTYGPSFQGLRAVWRRGEEVFAEIALPDEYQDEAARFGIHPALLDAALHSNGFVQPAGAPAGADEPRTVLPFAWNGLVLHAVGASALRVRVAPSGPDAVSLQASDEAGGLVLTTDSLVFRAVSAEQLEAASGLPGTDSLFRVEWTELPPRAPAVGPAPTWAPVATAAEAAAVAERGEALDAVVVTAVAGATGDDDALALTSRVLDILRAWLSAAEPGDSRLVVATRGAVPAGGDAAVTDPAGAAVWGLVRAAQAENPDRIVLLDLDPVADIESVLGSSLATGEPQVAVRGTTLSAPRLVRAAGGGSGADDSDAAFDAAGTVLVTGGTGSLGALLARHLVTRHGVRHLVLASRRGPDTPEARDLVEELTGLGAATVSVAACDVADREALALLLGTVAEERPLTAVIHTAGVLDDGVIGTLNRDRLANVFAPKVTAVRHLDELTRELAPELKALVVFSSAAGVFGSAGQGNYAAANAYLDGLMARRRATGLPALSLAWGPWEQNTGMTTGVEAANRTRTNRRGGILALTPDEGTALFDAALDADEALLVPIKLDLRTLRADAAAGAGVPPLLRSQVRIGRQVARAASGDGGDGLVRRLDGLTRAEQETVLLNVLRTQVAMVLGHAGPESVSAGMTFKDAGFDSLTSVELRNRVREATGLNLPATVVFDYPTPLALARHVHGELVPDGEVTGPEFDEERLRHALVALPLARFREAGLMEALVRLAALDTGESTTVELDEDDRSGTLAGLDVDDLVQLALGGDEEGLES